MKFKNFDIKDVLGSNDIEQAKAYIGQEGYFADTLEQLDRTINKCPNCLKRTLDSIDSLGENIDYYCTKTNRFRYFLPLDKVKKNRACKERG